MYMNNCTVIITYPRKLIGGQRIISTFHYQVTTSQMDLSLNCAKKVHCINVVKSAALVGYRTIHEHFVSHLFAIKLVSDILIASSSRLRITRDVHIQCVVICNKYTYARDRRGTTLPI